MLKLRITIRFCEWNDHLDGKKANGWIPRRAIVCFQHNTYTEEVIPRHLSRETTKKRRESRKSLSIKETKRKQADNFPREREEKTVWGTKRVGVRKKKENLYIGSITLILFSQLRTTNTLSTSSNGQSVSTPLKRDDNAWSLQKAYTTFPKS